MKLEEKSRNINDIRIDLRAEYVAFCLQEEGYSRDAILVSHLGSMKRKWSTDIDRSEPESFEGAEESLTLYLNRPGIYDVLPEALFHPITDSRHNTARDMAKDSMKLKTEEKNTRLFFRVFENEIFRKGVDIVDNENYVFNILNSGLLNEKIPGFWKIDESIPAGYASGIIKFLPVAHKVSGNYHLTALCLENIIGEKVKICLSDKENDEKKQLRIAKTGSLGFSKLGNNLIAGNEISGFIGRLVVTIGPLQKMKPGDFFHNSVIDRVLDCFYRFFIPVELEIETKLVCPQELNQFVLGTVSGQGGRKSVLGYSTVI